MRYILYILYRYYDKNSTKNIAYESAILALLLILFLNFFALAIFFDFNFYQNILRGKSKPMRYILIFILYILPCYLIISKIVRKKEMNDKKLSIQYKSIHGWLMFFYIVFSVIILIIVINLKHK